MTIIFSCPHPLRAGGPSRPLTRVHEALASWAADSSRGYRAITPEDFPELRDTARLGDGIGPAFDDLAREVAAFHDNVQILLAGGGASLNTASRLLSRASRGGGPSPCYGTLWFSSHHAYASKVLAEEYAAFGIRAEPIHPYVAWRAAKEQDLSDFIIVPSEACRSTYPSALREKAQVAEFGVDGAEFSPLPGHDAHVAGSRGPLRVLFPGTNPVRKGLRAILQAWGGLPPEKFELRATGNAFQPGEQLRGPPVRSLGWLSREEMLQELRVADVMLLPSLEEGQALAALEALACGVPVVVTPNVGLAIQDWREGVTVAPGDAAAIADVLSRLEADREALARMRAHARAYAEARPWSRFEARVIEILREAAA